jgi:hypothetical protein
LACSKVCHHAALTRARHGDGVIYIDTTNSFSAQRLVQMHEALVADRPRGAVRSLRPVSTLA